MLETSDVTLSRPVRLLHPRIPLYIVPRGDRRFMVGATMIESDDPGPISARSLMELLNAAYALHPAFGEARRDRNRRRRAPCFSDNLPRFRGRWTASSASTASTATDSCWRHPLHGTLRPHMTALAKRHRADVRQRRCGFCPQRAHVIPLQLEQTDETDRQRRRPSDRHFRSFRAPGRARLRRRLAGDSRQRRTCASRGPRQVSSLPTATASRSCRRCREADMLNSMEPRLPPACCSARRATHRPPSSRRCSRLEDRYRHRLACAAKGRQPHGLAPSSN